MNDTVAPIRPDDLNQGVKKLEAKLLRLCSDFHSTTQALVKAELDAEVDFKDIESLMDRLKLLLNDITAKQAYTSEGIKAKAAVLQATLAIDVAAPDPYGSWDDVARPHERLTLSLCRDLVGERGGATIPPSA